MSKNRIKSFLETIARPVSLKEMKKYLSVSKGEITNLLKDMEKEGLVVRARNNRYGLPTRMSLIKGELSCNPSGFGFVLPLKAGEEDVYISQKNMNDAMHGDKVVARVDRYKKGGKREGKIVRILERRNKPVIGRIERDRKRFFLIPEDRRIFQTISLGKGRSLRNGDIAVAEIVRFPAKGSKPKGRIIEVLGDPFDANVEVKSVIYKFDLPHIFSKECVTEAESVSREVLEKDKAGRKDLRECHFVTIDGESAKDFDDAICIERHISDGQDAKICGIMQHIEEAGVHSGDSMAVLPPFLLSRDQQEDIKEYTRLLARSLKVKGLMNIQFAIMFDTLYVIEVNPRASRTVPFVSKNHGDTHCQTGGENNGRQKELINSITNLRINRPMWPLRNPFSLLIASAKRIFSCGPKCGPPGRSWGSPPNSGKPYLKPFSRPGSRFPKRELFFISVNDNDKARALPIAEGLIKFGYQLVATKGTAEYIAERGLAVKTVMKIREGRPNVADDIKNGQIDMIINTPLGQRSRADEYTIGWTAIINKVPFITTLSAAEAIVRGLKARNNQTTYYKCLQDYYLS